jgi:hypothetical protein
MTSENSGKSVGEEMVEKFTAIAEALQELTQKGITKRLLVLYIQDVTKLRKSDIQKVLDAVEEFLKEFNRT